MKKYLNVHGVEYGVVEHMTLITDNGREYEVDINEHYDGVPDNPGNEAFDLEDWTCGGEYSDLNWFSIAVNPKPEDKEEYPDLEQLEFVFSWEDLEPHHVNYLDFDGVILDSADFEAEY